MKTYICYLIHKKTFVEKSFTTVANGVVEVNNIAKTQYPQYIVSKVEEIKE